MATCQKQIGWHADNDPRYCGGCAVIRYGGRNLCADCADPNVLALYLAAKRGTEDGYCGHVYARILDGVTALAPKDDL